MIQMGIYCNNWTIHINITIIHIILIILIINTRFNIKWNDNRILEGNREDVVCVKHLKIVEQQLFQGHK